MFLLLSIEQSCLFSVQKTTERALGTSVKDCVYIEALKGKPKSSGFYVHALLVFSFHLSYTACGTVGLRS